MPNSRTLTDHEEIRKWVEQRGGRPAVVGDTMNGSSGQLYIDFAESDEALEEIPWNDFFRIFEEHRLVFLCEEAAKDGTESRFFKFMERD